MSVFKLDEELSRLTVNGSCAIVDDEDFEEDPTCGEWHKNLLSAHPQAISPTVYLSTSTNGTAAPSKPRRRSSLYDKMAVSTPPNIKRLELAPEEDFQKANQYERRRRSFSKNHEPRSLEDFEPIRVLGQGAYGKVILVKDQYTSKLYAMKQLKKAEILISEEETKEKEPASVNLEKRLERTFAERKILSQLEHPNIVKLFYSFHDHMKLYLVLQFIPGGELFYHLKEQGTLAEDVVAFYAAEISCALRFLHGKGIVYRDLKPENCLLNEKGHLVLTDFGLSKKSVEDTTESSHDGEPITTLHSIIGTPEYCAPEILAGKSYNQNCDWYSLGCLVYDMLIGKPPYTGVNHKVILGKILKDKTPKIPMYLSDGMKDFLGALLRKEVLKRWDVDKFWNVEGPKNKKKKAGQAKTSCFQSHFVFRKVDWNKLESGELQKTTNGPILPIITDWELAENFDTEFTEMRLDSGACQDQINIQQNINPILHRDVFKGFSYVASSSYLERYF